MACRLCKTLKLKKVRKLDKDIRLGKKSIVQLASDYSTTTKAIIRHKDTCLKPEEVSGHQVLKTLLDTVTKDLKAARSDALYGDDEGGGRAAALLYTSLIREARELIAAVEKTKPNQQIGREIQTHAILPLVSQLAQILNEEGGNLHNELQVILGSDFNRNVERALKDTWMRMTKRIKSEYRFVDGRVADVLRGESAKPSKGQVAPRGRANMSDETVH